MPFLRQVGLSSLKIIPCLGDILLGGFYTLAAGLIQPVGNFVNAVSVPVKVRSAAYSSGGFRRKNGVLRLVFGADIGIFHALGGYRRFVDRLYRSLDNISS